MDAFAALAAAAHEFERRARLVTEEQWSAPTPCQGWTVHDLVNHVAAGNRMTVLLLDGGTRDEALAVFAAEVLDDDRVASLQASLAAQAAALAAPGALERVVHHPAGDLTGAVLLGFRTGDLTLHAWDLARAIGADDTLDPALCEHVWQGLQPMAPVIGQLGVFGDGPSGTVSEDAPLPQRLLDLTGRRP